MPNGETERASAHALWVDMSPWSFSSVELRERYRVRLLSEVSLGEKGVSHLLDGEGALLAWSEVERAITAEVGEPEGVRTIVFDLVVSETDGTFEIRRMDADPGEDAMKMAKILTERLGPECASASIKSVATDGIASRWFPDLESFERDAIHTLGE